MEKILQVKELEKSYGNSKDNKTLAVNNVSFELQRGEFVGIMGASGSGKTTLLNCISTIDDVSGGHIYLNGKDTTAIKEKQLSEFRRKNLGFIFQDYNLLDTLSLYENIALALSINNVEASIVSERVEQIAKRLGIDQILDRYPYQVSGGQKQRCACARAIVHEPQLILADEPTGALDSYSARILLETIRLINEEFKTTILMVTHDAVAASYADRIIFLKDGSIYNELSKESSTRNAFFNRIMDVMIEIGGGLSNE
ncbi:MAG: ABC transporter ATP-binding protein [Lachnospiraceae bacterium]|nr:ABC transporter ATP-binding protein [Lachnospiraceae bacterium]